ncbi:MAG: YceI family protein [Myxococcota bacterium]
MNTAEIIDPTTSTCFITVRREGLAAALGHDLRLEVTRHTLTATADALSAEFDAASLRVVGAISADGSLDTGALSAKDRATIEASIRDKVLETKRHPTVRFTAEAPTERAGGYELRGELALHGVTKTVAVRVDEREGRLVGKVTLHQPDWRITPFRGLLGALRVQADVEVEVSVARRWG